MKIGGVEIKGDLAAPNEDVLVIPRRSGQIVFTARALSDMDAFDKAVPLPKPPRVFQKGKGWIPDVEDKNYVAETRRFTDMKVAYIVVASLIEIEWETVDINKPNSWLNWEKDLTKSGFTKHECNLICQLTFQVNQLDEKKLEQARALFALGQELQQDESYSPSEEQSDTPSGEPVNDSE